MNTQEKKFTGKLVSIASEPTVNSVTGKKYFRCSVEMTTPSGEKKVISARIHEGNANYGVEVGKSYSCTATVFINREGNAQVDVVMSHLQNAGIASLADFGFEAVATPDLNSVK
jgi:hypothetical protein